MNKSIKKGNVGSVRVTNESFRNGSSSSTDKSTRVSNESFRKNGAKSTNSKKKMGQGRSS